MAKPHNVNRVAGTGPAAVGDQRSAKLAKKYPRDGCNIRIAVTRRAATIRQIPRQVGQGWRADSWTS